MNKVTNQPHPTKIVKIRAFSVFLKKSKITILREIKNVKTENYLPK